MRRAVAALAAWATLAFAGPAAADVRHAALGDVSAGHTVVVGASPDGVYRPLELDWGSFGSAARYAPLERGYAIVARDARLEERFTPHVLSFEPVRVWYWRAGAVHDVTREQPTFVRGDLASLLATRRTLLRRPDHAAIDLPGLLTAIAGDRLLLGQRRLAARELRADAAAGRAGSGSGPVGRAFPPAMLRLLARLGY